MSFQLKKPTKTFEQINNDTFHKATQFGEHLKDVAKKVGKYLLGPTRRVNQARNKKMTEMDRAAKAGEYNR